MSYHDGKVNDDKEFDFDKNGNLDELERYMQFDIINKALSKEPDFSTVYSGLR